MRLEEYKNRENPFSTPEGYFEELDRNIMESTCRPRVARRITLGLCARVLGDVAMLAIVALVAYQALTWEGAGSNVAAADNKDQTLDNELIDNILNNYPIDDYTFYSYMTDTDID